MALFDVLVEFIIFRCGKSRPRPNGDLTLAEIPPAGGRRRALMLLAATGMLIYVGVAFATDASKLLVALEHLGWSGITAVLLLSAGNYLLRFRRWQAYLHKLGRYIPTRKHLLYYVAGFAFTVSPGKAGEAVRSIYLRDHGVTYSESLAALFVERLLDLVTMVILASLIVLSTGTYYSLLIGITILVLLMLGLVCHPFLHQWLTAWAERRHQSRIAKPFAALSNLLRSSQQLLHPGLLAMGLLIGLVSWGAEGFGFYLICQSLGLHLTAVDAVGIYALSVLVGSAAIFLPSGIGGTEIVMTTLLVGRGATLPVALIATLLCRLATLWFAVLIGIAAATSLEFNASSQRANIAP